MTLKDQNRTVEHWVKPQTPNPKWFIFIHSSLRIDVSSLLICLFVFAGTLNYSCMTAPPPAPAILYKESFFDRNHCSDTPSSSSSWKHQHLEIVIPSFLTFIFFVIFEACYWMYCGEGKCTRSNTYDYKCECNSGYQNLLNVSVYPCYGECKEILLILKLLKVIYLVTSF